MPDIGNTGRMNNMDLFGASGLSNANPTQPTRSVLPSVGGGGGLDLDAALAATQVESQSKYAKQARYAPGLNATSGISVNL